MLEPCGKSLKVAEDLLAAGVVGESAVAMIRLRRCAQDGRCVEWDDCRRRVEQAWSAKGKISSETH